MIQEKVVVNSYFVFAYNKIILIWLIDQRNNIVKHLPNSNVKNIGAN